jgi:hypothetical protein
MSHSKRDNHKRFNSLENFLCGSLNDPVAYLTMHGTLNVVSKIPEITVTSFTSHANLFEKLKLFSEPF